MAKIVVGDLVCMYRRKKKGLGIVLEKVDDIAQSAGIEKSFDQVLEELAAIRDRDYNARNAYRRTVTESATNPEMVKVMMLYNGQGWNRKPKKTFVRVRWFEQPSAYEVKQSGKIEDWCPSDWLKKL